MGCYNCLNHDYVHVKKGRGQRKNKRDREGREQHRSTVILSQFFDYWTKQGLTVEEMQKKLWSYNE